MIESAIILAAGLGTRLAPLSAVRAKAALPVAGEPIIRRQLAWLAEAGVRRVVVNLHHLPSTVTRVVGHGDDLGLEVRYSWEPRVLGSGGGPRRAFDLLRTERSFIVNGDTLTDLNLLALSADHGRTGALVTMAGIAGDVSRYNALLVGPDRALTGVARAGSPGTATPGTSATAVHFIGVQVAERAAFDGVSPDVPSETVKEIYPAILARRAGAIRVWMSEAAFHDVGTPADYHRTVAAIAEHEGHAFDRGSQVVIDPSATLTRVVCWDDVRVGADVHLIDCVLADGVQVPPGFRAERSSLLRLDDRKPGPGAFVIGELLVAPFEAVRGSGDAADRE